MDEETHLQTAKTLTKALGYADDERVRAVYLVGSSATGEEDDYSDIDMMVVIDDLIAREERLERLIDIGGHSIRMAIAGVDNPALPVESEVIDKFVFQDTWFDVSYHLPHQLSFCFDFVTLVDKDNVTPQLCASEQSHSASELRDRVKADLRLLSARIYRYEKYARRQEWVGMDLSAIKRLIIDTVMVLNNQPTYNRHSSRITQLLRDQPVKPQNFEQTLLNILHLDNRDRWQDKLQLLHHLEADLTALCEERWGSIAMFDDDKGSNNRETTESSDE